MKKKLLAILLATSMVATMTACGSKDAAEEGNTEASADAGDQAANVTAGAVSSKDYDTSKYVKLGNYEGLEVTADVYTFTDEDVENELKSEVEYYVSMTNSYDYEVLDKTTVENGDNVNIDYVGKKDGVAFDGGSAQGAHLEIGSGSFIPGFEDGLIGHEVGETVSLDLTFPENYQSEELAGAAVVFEVKINSIDGEGKMPEINDELVTKLGMGFDSLEALKADVKNYLQESCDTQNKTARQNAVWDAVFATMEVNDPPQELVDDVSARIRQNAASYAAYNGMEVEAFIETNMKLTMDEYEKQLAENSVRTAKERLAIAALAKDAGIEVTDADLKERAETEYAQYGYESADEMLAQVGDGSYYDYILTEKVNDFLATKVTVKDGEQISLTESNN